MERSAAKPLVIDDQERGLFRVNRRVFTSQEILEREWEQIFNHCWLYAGHESEIPTAGDFRARRVGGRPVILIRGSDGRARVLLNTCMHRGALVCREKAGNSKTFQCSYHAWTYNNQGELIGVPGEEAYSAAFDRTELGLASAPRVESYRGLVFVSFNPAIEGLVDYLAGAKEYLDLACDYSETGLEIIGGTQAYSMRANWKLLVENSIDGYHATATHHRYFADFLTDMGVVRDGANIGRGVAKSLGNGHAAILYPLTAGGTNILGKSAKAELEAVQRRLADRFGAERAQRIMDGVGNLLIFPNLIYIDNWKTVRTFFPLSPDYVEITAWGLMPKEDSPELRQKRIDNFLTFLGPGGFATPDDVEALENCQRGFANREVEWSDISRGMKREQPLLTDELQMRTFWRRWHELITVSPPAQTWVRQAAALP